MNNAQALKSMWTWISPMILKFSASKSTFNVTSRYPSSTSTSGSKNLFLTRHTRRPVWLCVSTNKRTVCAPTHIRFWSTISCLSRCVSSHVPDVGAWSKWCRAVTQTVPLEEEQQREERDAQGRRDETCKTSEGPEQTTDRRTGSVMWPVSGHWLPG